METIRSFLAFDIEEEIVLRNISNVQDLLFETGAALKLVKPDNIHMTLRFLGNIPLRLVDEIHKVMEKIEFTPFKIEIKGLGVFPNLRRIRVIWMGIGKGASKLNDIFKQLELGLQILGFKPDPKGFNPHLTLARVKTGRNRARLAKRILDFEDYEFGIVTAECLRLKRSVLTPKGPIYSILKEKCCKT